MFCFFIFKTFSKGVVAVNYCLIWQCALDLFRHLLMNKESLFCILRTKLDRRIKFPTFFVGKTFSPTMLANWPNVSAKPLETPANWTLAKRVVSKIFLLPQGLIQTKEWIFFFQICLLMFRNLVR